MTAGPGHNSGVAGDRLRGFIERLERLREERSALTADMREVRAEAKAEGYDTKTLDRIVRLRAMDSADRREQEELLDLYMSALGMV